MFEQFGIVGFAPHTKVDGFVAHLAAGRLVASRCAGCGAVAFPPRADCPTCLGGAFDFVPVEPRGRLLTFTRIDTPPAGFEAHAPYTVGVVELAGGGRLLGWFDGDVPDAALAVDMPVAIVPWVRETAEGQRVGYTLELSGGA